MPFRLFLAALVLLLVSLLPTTLLADDKPPGDPNALLGPWFVESEKGNVHVTLERKGDEFVGHISWMEEPFYPEDDPRAGQPKLDDENPDEELRSRPIMDLEMMWGFRYHEKKREWKDGRIYAGDDGKTYRCRLKLEEDGRLNVRGFIKVGFVKLGRTMRWTRVEEEPTGD